MNNNTQPNTTLEALFAQNQALEARLLKQEMQWEALMNALQVAPDIQWLRHGIGRYIAKGLEKKA